MNAITQTLMSGLASRADADRDTCTPEGCDCTAYFERDWDEVSDDAVRGGRHLMECTSKLLGVVVHGEGLIPTIYSRDEATDAYGLAWVRELEARDAEEAE